jgi:hypothetical protein
MKSYSPFTSDDVLKNRDKLFKLFKDCPIPEPDILRYLPLYLLPVDLKKILFLNEMYLKILEVQGIIIEFGVLWGQNLALYQAFRGIYEPFNQYRKIVGFDTFEGFPSIHRKDGMDEVVTVGSYSVTENYEEYLQLLLSIKEKENPIDHPEKFELRKGNAISEIDKYLNENPETIISLAYFDFDLYEPTKKCIEAIIPHLTKGSILVFDQLNSHVFPGETLALAEVLGLDKVKIQRSRFSNMQSYIILE